MCLLPCARMCLCMCAWLCVCVCVRARVCVTALERTMTEFRVKDFAVNQLHKVNDEGNWRPL